MKLLLIILSLILAINCADSRYLESAKAENELSDQTTSSNAPDDDDVDLETYLEDYYVDLWQYLEGEKAGKKTEKEKPKLPDYDYMSDMAVAEPEVDGKKFKSLDRDGAGDEKENLTWTYVPNEPNFNNSYGGDGGIADVLRANRESNLQEEFPLRSKQMRLKSIIDQVLSFRGGSPRLNQTIPYGKQYNALREIYEKNIKRYKNEEWSSSYIEKVQSFYPLCDIPRNTDEDVWFNKSSMNLLFDLDFPSPQEDSTIMIVSAKLRLYKLPQENYSAPNTDATTPKTKWDKSQGNYGILPIDDDRQIRVSVYWYTKSLRRNRVKKRLLDSQMLSLYAPKWVEFNIRPAVRTWKESGKNFGLVVNVEDEDGTLLSADQFIQSMNCSKWTVTVRPLPSVIMDRFNQYFIDNLTEGRNETAEETHGEADKHKIFPYQPLPYPVIDLRTSEVPNSDIKNIALVNTAKKALEYNILNFPQKGFNDSLGNFLKKSSLELRDISRLSTADKFPRKSGEGRASYFQNVPIGSPSPGDPEEEPKSKSEFSDAEDEERNGERDAEREMPKIRHNRKQWDVFQKSTNLNSRARNDFNATDHH